MKSININIKKENNLAIIPSYAYQHDAAQDLTAVSVKVEDGYLICNTGIAMQIPNGFAGLIFPRSSIANKDLILSNSVGVIDAGYRGEILFKFKITKRKWYKKPRLYKAGDRVGQIFITPKYNVTFNEVESLEDSRRGKGGYGSSDKNNIKLKKITKK